MMPTPRYGLRLADNFWLIAHDELGRGLVSQHAIGLGLAGSLLAELLEFNKIAFTERGTVRVTNPRPPADRVGATLLGHIKAEMDNPNGVVQIRDWINYISGMGYAWVTQRLLENQIVEPVRVRQGLRRVIQYRVADLNDAVLPAVHVASRLRAHEPLQRWDIAFARFAHITNLGNRFDDQATELTWAYLRSLQEGLPPSLQFLLAETESMYGAAVLAHRI